FLRRVYQGGGELWEQGKEGRVRRDRRPGYHRGHAQGRHLLRLLFGVQGRPPEEEEQVRNSPQTASPFIGAQKSGQRFFLLLLLLLLLLLFLLRCAREKE